MNKKEKNTIKNIPPKYRPLGAWSYIGYNILFLIPLVGQICLIVFALSGSNINRRSYARSVFLVYLFYAIIIVAAFLVLRFAFTDVYKQLLDMIMGFIKGNGDNPEGSLAIVKACLGL